MCFLGAPLVAVCNKVPLIAPPVTPTLATVEEEEGDEIEVEEEGVAPSLGSACSSLRGP